MRASHTPCVYIMRFADGSSYVGSTVNFAARKSKHLANMRQGRHENQRVQQCYDSAKEPEFSVLISGLTPDTLPAVELGIIQYLKPSLNHYRPKYADRSVSYILPSAATVRRRMLTAFGQTRSLSEWARQLGVRNNLITLRIDYMGWSVERAVSEPAGERNRAARERNHALAVERANRRVSGPASTS